MLICEKFYYSSALEMCFVYLSHTRQPPVQRTGDKCDLTPFQSPWDDIYCFQGHHTAISLLFTFDLEN